MTTYRHRRHGFTVQAIQVQAIQFKYDSKDDELKTIRKIFGVNAGFFRLKDYSIDNEYNFIAVWDDWVDSLKFLVLDDEWLVCEEDAEGKSLFSRMTDEDFKASFESVSE